MTASVTIDRTSLSKAALVISDAGPTYRFTADGMGYVVRSVRITTAPDSADVDGSEIVAFAAESTGLTLEFYVSGDSSASVAAAVAELEEAFFRLSYPVTRTVDGVSATYNGGPCALKPVRGSVDSGVVAAHFDTYSVTIPFPSPNPVA